MTAFRESNGGVRGIVAGDALRRLIARTMAQQISEVVLSPTAPFQYASPQGQGASAGALNLGQFDLGQSAFIRLSPEKILWILQFRE